MHSGDLFAPLEPERLAMIHEREQSRFAVAAGDWCPPDLPELDHYPTIYLDREATGLDWYGKARPIGTALLLPHDDGTPDDVRYLPIGHASGNLNRGTYERWEREQLRHKHIINLNTGYDVHITRVGGCDLVEQGCTFEDVAHHAALLDDHRSRFNLDELAEDFLGRGKVHGVGGVEIDKSRMADYPAGLIAPYAMVDVEHVRAIRAITYPQIVAENLGRVLALENEIIPVVCEMEKNGIPINVALLDLWIEETARELERTLMAVFRSTGIRFKTPGDRDAMMTLFKVKRLPFPTDPETGSISFADDLLKPIPDPDIKVIRDAIYIASLRSKFLLKWRRLVGPDGILRYALHQLRTDNGEHAAAGTVSGRFSSSGGRKGHEWGINCQQTIQVERQQKRDKEYDRAPRWLIKQLVTPAEGQWVTADARQIEYRLFAHYANSAKLNAAYAADPLTDFHQMVSDLLAPKVPGLIRQEVKTVNFAQIYGAGLAKFCDMLKITESEGQALLSAYHGMFPEVKPLIKQASRVAERRGYVMTMLGRRARFRENDRHYSALNRIIQGSAADINKRVVVEVYKQRRDLELTMRMTVHDSIEGDLRNPEKGSRMRDVLNTQYFPTRIPILWDMGLGANWAEAK